MGSLKQRSLGRLLSNECVLRVGRLQAAVDGGGRTLGKIGAHDPEQGKAALGRSTMRVGRGGLAGHAKNMHAFSVRAKVERT